VLLRQQLTLAVMLLLLPHAALAMLLLLLLMQLSTAASSIQQCLTVCLCWRILMHLELAYFCCCRCWSGSCNGAR
jgi:hypothetical protein